VRRNEEDAGAEEENDEDGCRERFVREVGEGRDCFDNNVVDGAEVIHTVLKVAHVAEKVFGHFARGFDSPWRR